MYHKCKYTKKEIIQTNNLQKFEKIQRNNSAKIEKIQRNILKPACVVAVGVVFLAEVTFYRIFILHLLSGVPFP
jgi:hypothetical protein